MRRGARQEGWTATYQAIFWPLMSGMVGGGLVISVSGEAGNGGRNFGEYRLEGVKTMTMKLKKEIEQRRFSL